MGRKNAPEPEPAQKEYHVLWEIDCIWAGSPKEAAEKALKIHRDPDSMATVFDVTDEQGITTRVDLDEQA